MKLFNITKAAIALAGSLALSQVSYAALTSYGAGNISDTVNPAGATCTEDHGFWTGNAGIVEPAVAGCAGGVPTSNPVPIYPNLTGPAANEPTMTHRWWAPISFHGEMPVGDTSKSGFITPDPMTARVTDRGVRIMGIPAGMNLVNANENVYQIPDPFSEVFDGLAVGNTSYSSMDAYLKDHSDGSVTVEWQSGHTRNASDLCSWFALRIL